MLKRWSSAFMTENCGDPNRFTYCRRYLIISYVQFWGLYVTTFQLAVPKGPKIKLPEPRGAPHMGPHAWPNLQCEFQATPLPFSHSPSTSINHFQSKSQLTHRTCWFPMAVSNQVVSLDQRLTQWTVLKKINFNGQNHIASFCPQL